MNYKIISLDNGWVLFRDEDAAFIEISPGTKNFFKEKFKVEVPIEVYDLASNGTTGYKELNNRYNITSLISSAINNRALKGASQLSHPPEDKDTPNRHQGYGWFIEKDEDVCRLNYLLGDHNNTREVIYIPPVIYKEVRINKIRKIKDLFDLLDKNNIKY